MQIRPVDMPELRAETEAMLDEFGVAIYQHAIEAGVQRLKPDLATAREQAQVMTEHETARLQLSELYFVSTDMAILAKAAARTMPDFRLVPEDLPSESGFIYFEEPIDIFEEVDGPGDLTLVAACWGPCWGTEQGPALWITWYTDAAAAVEVARSAGNEVARWPSRLLLQTESLYSLEGLPTHCLGNDGVEIGWNERDEHSQAAWSATLKATWLLMMQPIGRVADAHFDRSSRRRLARADLPDPRVRVITLRHSPGPATGESGREFHHRWVVRGHWRMQACGEGRTERRPTWIVPHVKGPEGAPLLGGEKVYALKR